jgi:hypothetical protein
MPSIRCNSNPFGGATGDALKVFIIRPNLLREVLRSIVFEIKVVVQSAPGKVADGGDPNGHYRLPSQQMARNLVSLEKPIWEDHVSSHGNFVKHLAKQNE